MERTTPTAQASVLSRVGIPNPTSPSVSSKVNFNNNFQPTLKDLVYGQKQINDNISKKFLANDKILESLAIQLEGINTVIKN